MLTVRVALPENAAAYDSFARANPGGLLYHSWAFRELVRKLTDCRPEYLLAWRDGRIVGALPLMSKDGPFGEVVNSLPFFGSHGGILTADAEAERALAQAYRQRVVPPAVAAATVIVNPFGQNHGSHLPYTHLDRRIGQVTDLPDGPDAADVIFESYDGSARRNIRKAEKSGVRVAIENDAVDFLESCHRSGMTMIGGRAKPAEFFRQFPAIFQGDRDYRIYVARVCEHPVAALLVFYYGDTVEYFIPAVEEGSREAQPMALILFHAMSEAASWGFRRWSWGGTWLTQTGVYRFKKKWGARDVEYSYLVQINNSAVLEATPQALSDAYPFFYVAPYDALHARAATVS